MDYRIRLLYTIIVFLVLCVVSYAVSAQPIKLGIKDAVQLSLKNNRDVKAAALDVTRSQEGERIAKSALLPKAAAQAQVLHYFVMPPFFGFGTGDNGGKIPYGRFGGKDQAMTSLAVSQPLFNPYSRPGIAIAKLQTKASQLGVTDSQSDIVSAVKQTYLQILVLQERIKLQQESMNRNLRALEDARLLLAQGKALRVDTLRAFTSYKNLEPEILQLSNAALVGLQQLKALTGIDSVQQVVLSDSIILPADNMLLTEAQVYDQARTSRADLKLLELQPQFNEQDAKLAAAATKPSVSLIGEYMLQTQAKDFNYVKASYPSSVYVGAQLNVPIFSGFANTARIKQAGIARQQSVERISYAYDNLRTEVKQVVANLQESAGRIETRNAVKATAQLSYDITQYRYSKGVATRLELTDAELALTAAQLNYLEAVYDHLSAHIALDHTIGKTE